jgi:isocitrate dehydrogenase
MNPNHSNSNPADTDPATGRAASDAGNNASHSQEQGRAEALYDRFTDRARELFESGQEKGKEAMEAAMETARQQIAAAGEFSAEQGEQFKQYMRHDMDQTAEDLRELGSDAKTLLHPSRLGAGALSSIARALDAAGTALTSLAKKAESPLHFKTGEITSAGTLTCLKCGQKVQMEKSSHIPPCPSCHHTEFRKGY